MRIALPINWESRYILAICEIIGKMYLHIKCTFLPQMCNGINHIPHGVSRTASIGLFSPSQYKTISVNQARVVQPSHVRHDITLATFASLARAGSRKKKGKKKNPSPQVARTRRTQFSFVSRQTYPAETRSRPWARFTRAPTLWRWNTSPTPGAPTRMASASSSRPSRIRVSICQCELLTYF